jgi:integrase
LSKVILETCRTVEARDTLETAHRLREHYLSVFRFVIAEGTDLCVPCYEICDALKRPPVRQLAAITMPLELTGLLKAIDTYSETLCVLSALKILPMLMVQLGKLHRARWDEFDHDHDTWYLPSICMKRTKAQNINGEPYLMPLTRQTVQISEELFKVTGESGCIFPLAVKTGGFISEKTLSKAMRIKGCSSSQITAHSFRATARTLILEILQILKAVIEAPLAYFSRSQWTATKRSSFLCASK